VKTAISLPDGLYRLAETAARRLQVSRSQFYAAAIAEYLERRQSESVTKRLDEIYSGTRARLDPALERAQTKSLEKDRW
jgi:metal-responsive CopG/Arc/MetJ family transcriptional regulator